MRLDAQPIRQQRSGNGRYTGVHGPGEQRGEEIGRDQGVVGEMAEVVGRKGCTSMRGDCVGALSVLGRRGCPRDRAGCMRSFPCTVPAVSCLFFSSYFRGGKQIHEPSIFG